MPSSSSSVAFRFLIRRLTWITSGGNDIFGGNVALYFGIT